MRLKIEKKGFFGGITEEITRPEELIRADMMLKFFKKAEKGVYPVAESQRKLIKDYWEALHNYTGAQFSFNETFTSLKKY